MPRPAFDCREPPWWNDPEKNPDPSPSPLPSPLALPYIPSIEETLEYAAYRAGIWPPGAPPHPPDDGTNHVPSLGMCGYPSLGCHDPKKWP